MSEPGWSGFLAAAGVDDRVAPHGATAAFRVEVLEDIGRRWVDVGFAPAYK